jgi:hypothetical protein
MKKPSPPPTTSTSIKASLPPVVGKAFNPANFVRPGVDEAQII